MADSILAMLPVTELRGAIPLALALGLTPLKAYVLAVLGNMVPIIPLLLLLEPVSRLLRRFPAVDRLFRRLLDRTRQKGREVEKYGLIGLTIFVAIPLPGTGAWTGALIAWLLGFNFILSAIALGAGVIAAGILVLLVCLGFIKMTLLYNLEYILVLLLIAVVVYVWYKHKRR